MKTAFVLLLCFIVLVGCGPITGSWKLDTYDVHYSHYTAKYGEPYSATPVPQDWYPIVAIGVYRFHLNHGIFGFIVIYIDKNGMVVLALRNHSTISDFAMPHDSGNLHPEARAAIDKMIEESKGEN